MSDVSNLKNLAVSETGFVFDPRSGATFTVNGTGLAILTALRDGASVDAVVEQLRGRFSGASDAARDDVLEFVRSLRRHGVLPPEPKP